MRQTWLAGLLGFSALAWASLGAGHAAAALPGAAERLDRAQLPSAVQTVTYGHRRWHHGHHNYRYRGYFGGYPGYAYYPRATYYAAPYYYYPAYYYPAPVYYPAPIYTLPIP